MSKDNEECIVYKFYNNKNGTYIQATEDADGLGLIEVRNVDENGQVCQSITLTEEQANWLTFRLPSVVKNLELKRSPSV